MKLKIQPLPGLGCMVFALTGQMQRENLAELQSLLDLKTSCEEFVLDLKELKVVDRESIRSWHSVKQRGWSSEIAHHASKSGFRKSRVGNWQELG